MEILRPPTLSSLNATEPHDRRWAVLDEWDNGAPPPADDRDPEAAAQAWLDEFDQQRDVERRKRAELAAAKYDEPLETMRLTMLRAEADAAFFGHIVDRPANPAQRDKAEQRMVEQQTTAQKLRDKLGDPEEIMDRDGYYPAERRAVNLNFHITFWRHPALRELQESKQRKRFAALLAMRPVEPAAICSECQAPVLWHEYALSLCLFRPQPAPDTTAAKIATLTPGWWQRCTACTAYQIEHLWGGPATLRDFGGEQWAAMLPPTLKAVFVLQPAKPRRPAVRHTPLAVVTAGNIDDVLSRLTEAKDRFPDTQIRSGPHGTWEVWPST